MQPACLGECGALGRAVRALSSTLPLRHPKRHFPRVGDPCRAQSREHRPWVGAWAGGWAGAQGRGLCWELWVRVLAGLGAEMRDEALGSLLVRASSFYMYKAVSKQQNPLIWEDNRRFPSSGGAVLQPAGPRCC